MGSVGSSNAKTILLVENDDLVRRFLNAFLDNAGYEVLVAATGKRAIELAQEYAGTIHLLVCCWTMRGLDGQSVVTQIEAARPGLKVILLSESDPEPSLKSEWTFVPKPFDRHEFLAKVRDLLTDSTILSAAGSYRDR